MKEELANADNMVKTVAQFESQILQTKSKKLIKRPKSARNLLSNFSKNKENSATTGPKEEITPNKKLIEAFQERDKEVTKKKLLMKSKSTPDFETLRPRMIKIINATEEESTLLKPTFSSIRKAQPYTEDNVQQKYERSFELDTKLLAIDTVPKLGLPEWRRI